MPFHTFTHFAISRISRAMMIYRCQGASRKIKHRCGHVRYRNYRISHLLRPHYHDAFFPRRSHAIRGPYFIIGCNNIYGIIAIDKSRLIIIISHFAARSRLSLDDHIGRLAADIAERHVRAGPALDFRRHDIRSAATFRDFQRCH